LSSEHVITPLCHQNTSLHHSVSSEHVITPLCVIRTRHYTTLCHQNTSLHRPVIALTVCTLCTVNCGRYSAACYSVRLSGDVLRDLCVCGQWAVLRQFVFGNCSVCCCVSGGRAGCPSGQGLSELWLFDRLSDC
jgi:hypothetical protein